ncbi:MAG: phosphoadenosine phosphosulfate reductase family protein [Bacilli bacterium]|nr:phosphoadenosine phosphosulfate reductase family protein [Bacilli bacterium]
MIKYICKNCDNLSCETSICPVCKERTFIDKSAIYYCDKCHTPVFEEICPLCKSDCGYIGTDIRPVFPEERLLVEIIEGKPFKYANQSIWNTSGNNYLVNGKKIKFSIKDAISKDVEMIKRQILENSEKNQQFVDNFFDEQYIKNFLKANLLRYNAIVTEAHDYIKNVSSNYDTDSMFVSFSGGKDSTVTSDLVMNALNTDKIIHIYGNTTLEYPETETYMNCFKSIHPATPILVAKNKEQNFNELCKVIGPPSRVMRWCCTIFKTGSITKKIETTFKGKTKLLTFQGLRRNESIARSKYDREGNSSKISKQQTVAPIIDWLDFDVWLYLLTRKIPFNNAYKKGFARVGCWCCPNNSAWSEFLSSIYMPEQYKEFHDILLDFAIQTNKKSPEEYVSSGGWKARQGGNGLNYSSNAVLSFKPCVLESNAINFELNKPINDNFYELFKPFGKLDFNIGNKRLGEVYVLDKQDNTIILKIAGKIGKSTVKISIINNLRNLPKSLTMDSLIKDQITKFQTCIGCNACESVCKLNAISIKLNQKQAGELFDVSYKINENKCVGCLECVKHFSGGCYMKKVLRTKGA